MFELMLYALGVVIVALLVDIFIGEPPNKLHPVVWIGSVISFLDKRISRGSPKKEKAAGVLMALIAILLFAFLSLLLLTTVRHLLDGSSGPWWPVCC